MGNGTEGLKGRDRGGGRTIFLRGCQGGVRGSGEPKGRGRGGGQVRGELGS